MVEGVAWDGYIQMFSTVFALAIAWYCFRLTSFFKGGVFYEPFRVLGPAFVLYALGSFLDIFPEFYVGPEWLHVIHLTCYAAFFALVTYGFSLFYKVWRQMGMKVA